MRSFIINVIYFFNVTVPTKSSLHSISNLHKPTPLRYFLKPLKLLSERVASFAHNRINDNLELNIATLATFFSVDAMDLFFGSTATYFGERLFQCIKTPPE